MRPLKGVMSSSGERVEDLACVSGSAAQGCRGLIENTTQQSVGGRLRAETVILPLIG